MANEVYLYSPNATLRDVTLRANAPAAGGGSTYNDSLNESVGTTDSVINSFVIAGLITESVSSADSFNVTNTLPVFLGEAQNVTEANTVASILAVSLSEPQNITASAASSQIINVAFAEAQAVADNFNVVSIYNNILAETVLPDLFFNAGNIYVSTISESISTAENVECYLSLNESLLSSVFFDYTNEGVVTIIPYVVYNFSSTVVGSINGASTIIFTTAKKSTVQNVI